MKADSTPAAEPFLIAVAHPDFREELQAKAEEYGIW